MGGIALANTITYLSQRREKTDLPQAPKPEAFEFIPGPKLRAKLGISAVTLLALAA